MSRRGKRHAARGLLAWLVAPALVLIIAGCMGASPTQSPAATPAASTAVSTSASPAASAATAAAPAAQTNGTPAAAVAEGTRAAPGTVAAKAGTPSTPSATGTPAPTPTPTATLTDLQNRLALARAYLDGKDYDSAATQYSQLVQDSRGNADALKA